MRGVQKVKWIAESNKIKYRYNILCDIRFVEEPKNSSKNDQYDNPRYEVNQKGANAPFTIASKPPCFAQLEIEVMRRFIRVSRHRLRWLKAAS